MNIVSVNYQVFWQFKDYPELKVTKDKKIINSKTCIVLKYNKRGYFIKGQYYKRNELNKMLEKIPIFTYPF